MSQPAEPRPGSLTLDTHWPASDVAVLGVGGEVDMRTAPALEQALDELLDRAPRTVVVDLTEVGFLGSAGLAVLVTAYDPSRPPTRSGSSPRPGRPGARSR